MAYHPSSIPYSLDVEVISAENLLPKDTNGLSDPYCKLTLQNDHFKQFFKTKVITKTLDPVWNQKCVLYPQFEKNSLLLSVWDRDILTKDDFLGCVRYPLENLVDGEAKEVKLELKKIRLFKFCDEEVRGMITLKLQLNFIGKKRVLGYFNFQDPFDSNGRFRKAKLRDCSGEGNHGEFKNLECDNVVQTLGMKTGSFAGKFSGFNYIELPKNPLRYVSQWSVSIWFFVEDPKGDHVLLSAMTSDPKDIKLKKNERRPPILIKEYGKTASASNLPIDEVEETKMFNSGILVCTRGNRFYDNFGRSLLLADETNKAVRNMYQNDLIYCPEHFPFPKQKRLQESVLVANREDIEEDFDDPNHLRVSLMKKKDWNHLVITYDGDSIKEYINGVLVDDSKCTFEFLGYGKALQIGGYDNDMCLRGMKGLIDNLRLFNYVLDKKQVEKLLSEIKKQ